MPAHILSLKSTCGLTLLAALVVVSCDTVDSSLETEVVTFDWQQGVNANGVVHTGNAAYIYGSAGRMQDVLPHRTYPLVLTMRESGEVSDTMVSADGDFGEVLGLEVDGSAVHVLVAQWTEDREQRVELGRLDSDGSRTVVCTVGDARTGRLLPSTSDVAGFLVPRRDGVVERYDTTCSLDWSYTLSGAGNVFMTSTSDGGLVVAGGLYGEEMGSVGIARVRDDGSEAWRVDYTFQGGDLTPRLVALADDNPMMVGIAENAMVVTRFSAQGEVLWERVIEGAEVFPVAAAVLPDDGAAIAYREVSGDGVVVSRLIGLSSNDDVTWRHRFAAVEREARIESAVALNDGRLMAVGTVGRSSYAWHVDHLRVEVIALP